MKKIILIAAILATLGTTAYAQLENVKVEYDSNNMNNVVVSGKTTLGAGTKITVSVFKKDMDYSSLSSLADGTDVTSILKNVDTDTSAADGSWSITYEPDSTDDYDIYISEGNAAGIKYPVFIGAQMPSKFNIIQTGTQAQIQQLVSVHNDYKAIYPSDADRAKLTAYQTVGTAIFKVRESLANPVTITSNLNAALLYAAYAEKGTAATLDELVDAFTLSGIGDTFYATYKASPAAVKEDTASKASTGAYNLTATQFNEKLKSQFILSGVEKAVNWTEAVAYLDLLENATYQANKQAIANYVVGKEYTMPELLAAINSYTVTPTPRPSTSGGGGFSGSIVVPDLVPDKGDQEMQVVFTDVPKTHWSFEYVNYLKWNDIVDGDESGSFKPDDSITRAEFVKIICAAFDITTDKNMTFNDVKSDEWYYQYVQAAAASGLIYGDESGNFRPQDKITREDISVISYRLMTSYGMELSNTKDFEDVANVSDYAKEAVSSLAGEGILSGSYNMFNPKNNATRAEAATIIYKIIKATEE